MLSPYSVIEGARFTRPTRKSFSGRLLENSHMTQLQENKNKESQRPPITSERGLVIVLISFRLLEQNTTNMSQFWRLGS